MPIEVGSKIAILGIDCAVDPKRMGVSAGVYRDGKVWVERVARGDSFDEVLASVNFDLPLLVAIDSPLGWPEALGEALTPHRAGQPIGMRPERLFRRETDRAVREHLGKQPLEVGADRIARTAVRALEILDGIGRVRGLRPVLAWSPEEVRTLQVIEVYPAATLKQHGFTATGYKGTDQQAVRAEQIRGLSEQLQLVCPMEPMLHDADCLDAVVCLLAAKDFLSGKAMPPADRSLAEKEGWIWFRQLASV